jgi:phospholipid/cholesterol/gamma-HCH transport system substrate-binding protein
VFGTTPEPLLGANPPKPQKRPPLNGTVPCETQEAPDLRTIPGDPPPQRQINTNSSAFQARYSQARGKAINWLTKQLKIEGLQDVLDVATQDITPQLVDKIAKAGK